MALVIAKQRSTMQSYEYDSDFVVTQKAGASFDFEIIPVKGNASYDSSRSDIQHLNIKIDAVHIVGGKVVGGGKPFFVIPEQPVLSVPSPRPSAPQMGPVKPVCKEHIGGTTAPGGRPFSRISDC